MNIAKADKNDMNAAAELVALLNHVSSGYYPDTEDEDMPLFFDEDDHDHLHRFFEKVIALVDKAPGGLLRVVWGFEAIMRSGAINPDVDHLEFLPQIAAGDELLAACRAIDRDIEQTGVASEQSIDLVRAAIRLAEGKP